jgi:hypothetical protein
MIPMLPHDSWQVSSYRQQDLLAEAESERLVAMLPDRKPLRLRQALARACYRLASWLDTPRDTRLEDWASPTARA